MRPRRGPAAPSRDAPAARTRSAGRRDASGAPPFEAPGRSRRIAGAGSVAGAIVGALLLAAAAGLHAAPPNATHATHAAPPAPAPQRIVSLLPSLTETVCALGACERLVGTDRYSNWPASVQRLPKLGGIDDAQIERIVALRPDLVLVSASARVTGRLESLGVAVLVLEARNQAEVKHNLVHLAQRLGVPDAAERVWSGIERDIAAAAQRVPPALRGQRVYFEIDATPYAAGAGSFIGELLVRLGLANAVPAEWGAFPKLGPEAVVRLQPDLVMAERRALEAMPARPGWGALHALRDRRGCGFESASFDVLVRPGPRIGEAARLLADCLVPLAPGAAPAGRP